MSGKRCCKPTVKRALVCVILLAMPARSAPPPHAPRQAQSPRLSDNARVRAALDWLTPNISWVNDQQARITEIPAPPFQEAQRAAAVKELLAEAGLAAQIDKTGNVIGELRGVNEKEIVVVSAHLDTVFPPDTDVKVHRDGSRMTAPGGMRAIVDNYRGKLKAVVVLDGSGTDHVTTKALASRRLEALITGPGGHSWSDFGMPNPINALVRGSVRFINTRVPATARTTFNIGQIEGGTSVNSVPHEARLKVDIRSESEDELARLELALRECIAAGVRDEMESARDRSKGKLEWKVELLGSRPGGELAADSPLLAALRAADEFIGNQSRIERSSTDANVPLSLGIEAISIGAGGNGGGAHSLQEWYDATGREAGLKRPRRRSRLLRRGRAARAPEAAEREDGGGNCRRRPCDQDPLHLRDESGRSGPWCCRSR